MADFLAVLSVVGFIAAFMGSSGAWSGYDRVQGILLGISVVVFIYLGHRHVQA